MVFDLNETPLPSPRDTATVDVNGEDEDVVIIEAPKLLFGRKNRALFPAVDGAAAATVREVEVKRRAQDTEGAAVVVCTDCLEQQRQRFNGTPQQLRQWRCFKCLLKNDAGCGKTGDGPDTGSGGGATRLEFLDINAPPPREAEAEGGCSGLHEDMPPMGRWVGDRNHGDNHPVGLLSTYSTTWSPDKRFHLSKLPQTLPDTARSAYDTVGHIRSSSISLNQVDGSTDDERPQAQKSTLTDCLPKTPKELYLEGLIEYIAERKGVLDVGWHVEFVFCSKRLKTFPVYHAPDGKRFESIFDVAHHLGLPSNSHSLQAESDNNEIDAMQNGTRVGQRRKESLGPTRAVNSRQIPNVCRSNNSLRASLSGLESTVGCQDGFPIQLEDFYLISPGIIDVRPSYHSTTQIWPVGYKSIWHDMFTGSIFVFHVTDGGDSGPNFVVQRYPCTAQKIPFSSTVLSRPKLGCSNVENNIGKDDSSRFSIIDEESISIQMMLTESSPPHLDDDISSGKTGSNALDCRKEKLPSSDSFSQNSGNLTPEMFKWDSVGEFLVEGRSTTVVWEKVCETFIHACYDAYKQKGSIQFGCDHEFCEINVKRKDNLESLSKFSRLAGPLDIPKLVQSDHEFQSACDMVAKWLQQDRFGLDAEFVQEIVEQIPGVSGCAEYSPLSKRKHHLSFQTVKSGFLQSKRKVTESDGYNRSAKRPRQHPRDTKRRGPFPTCKPLCSRLPTCLIGDALQVWEFFWRFFEVLGLQDPFSFQEMEEELVNPWLDALNSLEKLGTAFHGSGDVSPRSSRKVPWDKVSDQTCTGMVLARSHGSLLNVLAGELLSKVAVYVDPNFDAGESKSRRGRKKDADSAKKRKLGLMPVNELTWPEIARRYILAVLSMDGAPESSEIACRESGRVFHCLRGDGGILCGSLTGVAALEADAFLLAEATKKIFGPLKVPNDALHIDQKECDVAGASKGTEVNNGEVPEWAQVLEPVRKLPTNVGARIRRCVNEALQKNPPEWAKKKLEHAISKEVYKGNASGPTKRAVIEVLTDVAREKPQQKPEKKETSKSLFTSSDLIMKQCRIILRRAVAEDEEKVFCNLVGRTLLNLNDNDDEGLLGRPAMVSRPLDFRTIDLRLAAGAYGGSHEAFLDDVREVWQNVHNAYREQSDLIDLAETLSKNFEDLYEKEVVTLVKKTMESGYMNCSENESEKERDDALALVSESSLPKAPWDEGICKVCGMDKDDDNVLLCDSCDSEYHTYCLNPPLIKIPEGNWYCPSCVSGQSFSQSAATYGTQVVYSCTKRKFQGENMHKNLEMLAKLAKTMDLKEYWEFTMEERIFLMKFLCDETLSSAAIHDHIDKCASTAVDLQQRLRSLNSERKLLQVKEESLSANMAKMKVTLHTSGGESGLNRMSSVATDEVQLSDAEKISPSSGDTTQMEVPFTVSSQLKHQHSGKDGQNVDSIVCDIDSQMLGNSSSVSVQSSSGIMSGCNLSGSAGKDMVIHFSPVQGLQCSNQANASSSQEQSAELSNLRNEFSVLHDSIGSVESELLKVSIRREFLGRDADGRLYWVFARPGSFPWILVNGSSSTDDEFGPESLFRFTSWMSCNTFTEVEELVNWLDDGDMREREVKESILQWQSNKFLETSYVEIGISNRGKSGSNIVLNGEKALDPNFLGTKAMRELEKKFGLCLEIQADDIHNNLVKEGKVTGQGKMYRCECLELLWTSRHHCFSCHKTFLTSEELTQHTGEKCKVVPMRCENQMTESSSKDKRKVGNQLVEKCSGNLSINDLFRNEKHGNTSTSVQILQEPECKVVPMRCENQRTDRKVRNQLVEKCSGNLSIYDMFPNEKHGNTSTPVQILQEPECPFNFEEIRAKFRTENSLKELVKEIGLIGSNGMVSFVPSTSPYLKDPALTLNKVSLENAPSVPESEWKPTENGANDYTSNKKVPNHLRSIKNGRGDSVGEVQCMKPPLFSERGLFFSTKDRNSIFEIWRNCFLRESSLRPKVGKASLVLRLLKINLLDIDAALPEAALRLSRSSYDRRYAWRTFVKSANSLYEMVQAIIILEDMIKTDYLRKDWWYWSSPSAAANISTLSALALRIYTLDSAILYEKPSLGDDTAEILEADCKSDKEAAQSAAPCSNYVYGDQPIPNMADSDSGDISRPRTRTSKRRRGSSG